MAFIDIVNSINKQIPGALPDLRDRSLVEFPHISTGSLVVDYVTGISGLPRGRITELHGLQSAGKSTCALMTAAECQTQPVPQGVLYLDFEHSIDPAYAETLGVSLEPALWAIMQPDSMESGLRVAKHFMEESQGACGMIICDSVAAMQTIQDKSHEVGETQIGTQAQVMSTSLRQLKHEISVSNVVFVFINQLRDVVDLSWAGQQRAKSGPQYTTPGGRALKFYADIRLEFLPIGQEKVKQDALFGQGFGKEGTENVVIGQKARVTAVKNKCAAPFKSGEIFIRSGKGIDSTVPCVDLAVKFGFIRSKAAYFYVPAPYCEDELSERTIQGKENLYAYFESNPEKLQALFQVVWQGLQQMKEVG